ncbi:MAG: chemotaxis protein CheA [Lachnospiraceae bacterium]|nr:chemotaxis protein CheA [Lachnospiraceae bacterium]
MDVSQYLEIFIDETREHLQALNEHILILEKEPDNQDTINEIFRAAHSLKGMAGTMGYTRMQRLTHDMENVFSEIRNGNMTASDDLVDVLFKGLDALENYLDNIVETAAEGTEDNEDIITRLNEILEIGTGKMKEVTKEAPKATSSSKAEEKPAVDEKAKYTSFVYAEHERHAIASAAQQNMKAYGMTVYVDENCLLKAARAFLVFKALEDVGTIIKSVPEIQDIEDEKFDFDFSIAIISPESIDKVQKVVANVSEIKEVVISEVSLEDANNQDVVAKEETVDEEATKASEIKVTSEEKSEPAQLAQPAQQTSAQPKQGAQNNQAKAGKPVVNRTVRVDIEKLDVLMNLVSELIIAKNGLVSIGGANREARTGFNEQIEYLESITTNLHESVMKVRMVPIESVVNRFPRMIRDLAKKLDKKMELYMSGEDTELDRTVIDEIGDPLMHILRNSADHGIESAQVRAAAGKPEVGTINLNAYQEGNNVIIEVVDDGGGVNVDKVKAKAIATGVITQEQADAMTDKEAVDLLFRPSFSTADKISDVSGRGVGLDVVKSKIESLGGDVECHSTLGVGSRFIIRLPLTLAIIQALMVEIGTEKYALPLGNIQTIEDVEYNEIKYVQSKEVINLRGSVIPLVRMDEILDVPRKDETPSSLTVVIVAKGDKKVGLIVSSLIGQQEIVIKPLGKYININKIISGATILGDGEVALILNVNTLV